MSLSSAVWRFRESSAKSWQPAIVPGCVHTDLLRAGRIPDPFFGANELDLRWIEERDWEYRSRFNVSASLLTEEVVELVADGLDTVATVTLNGHSVGHTENMFVGHRWSVKPLLRRGSNDLRIRFRSAMDYIRSMRMEFTPPREFNDPVGGAVRIRKQPCQFGWDWGPRFVTAGIWRDIRLEAWSGNRLESVRLTQEHRSNGSVVLHLAPELAWPDEAATVTWRLTRDGRREDSGPEPQEQAGVGCEIVVDNPALWWPNGQGAQALYRLDVEAVGRDSAPIGRWSRRIGLRTIVLDRSPDAWGEAFRFVVNGRPVFLKGANWIPAHSFVAGLGRADYERNLNAAAAANMNAIRVWGGGIYESEDFYDLCDELGLLVWQDFMFACTLYPSDAAFLASVRDESVFQIRRLRHRASLALWCGNNEIGMLHPTLHKTPELHHGYLKLFHELLPGSVAAHDPATPYWPSSQWRGSLEKDKHEDGERVGDTHYWDVWHARHPVKDYEKWAFRFVSEFGMQSYSSPATNATFCPPGDTNVFGPSMENHQKNCAGNQIILDYVSRRYRFPKSQTDLIYLSQLNQAYCMQVGVEHFRRLMPRCMGALYWQLNDCWPVASWSSLEFTGRWKAIHYAARRFFAPALVSIHLPGDEKPKIGNYRESTITEAHLYTVYDAPESVVGTLTWELRRFDGRRVLEGRETVSLQPGASVNHRALDLRTALAKHGREQLYLRATLSLGRRVASEQTAFLCAPRFLELPRAAAKVTMRAIGSRELELIFRSPVFLHAVAFDLPGLLHTADDNYFDLYPGVTRKVHVSLLQPVRPKILLTRLRVWSLVDSYD